MAIAVRGTPTTGEGGGGSLVINKPTGVVNGDVMLALITVNGGTVTARPTAGWQNLASINTGTGNIYVDRRIVSGDAASFTWTLSGMVTATGVLVARSGVDNTTPEDITSTTINGYPPITIPGGTTVTAGAQFVGLASTIFGTATWAAPSGWTTEHTNSGSPSNRQIVAYEDFPTAGATGSALFTHSDTGNNAAGIGVFLRPASGGGADTTAPVVTSRVVDGSTLIVTYDEPLSTSHTPAASAFTCTVAGSPRAISNVSVSGSTCTLTLASPVVAGQTVTLSYVP